MLIFLLLTPEQMRVLFLKNDLTNNFKGNNISHNVVGLFPTVAFQVFRLYFFAQKCFSSSWLRNNLNIKV